MITLEALARVVEADLEALWIPDEALRECLEAHAYPTLAGGKRLRPLLTLLCAAALGDEDALMRSRPTACALELIHTYSLVHDDLPCMDDDALRRGRPTTHIVYGEAKALLVGDGLLTHALFLVSSRGRAAPWLETLTTRAEACDALEALSLAAGPYGMVGGQWLDMTATGGNDGFALVREIHRLKTGRLLGAALECGVVHGLAARFSPDDDVVLEARERAREAGELAGIAFQIVDDILDATQPSEKLGKTAGKDESAGKLTSVSALGLEGARAQAFEYTSQARQALGRLLELALKTSLGTLNPTGQLLSELVSSLLSRTK